MAESLPVLVIIPARGGSKGVPRKNLREVLGKPLLQYPIETARQSGYAPRVVVSTDDAEIGALAERLGVEVVWRPAELATDTALVTDAIRYTLRYLEETDGYVPAVCVLLQTTSPVRRVEDFDSAVAKILAGEADSVVTFSELAESPARIWRLDEQTGAVEPFIPGSQPFLPRQQLPTGYHVNGQLYAFTPGILAANPASFSLILGRHRAVITPRELVVDIDDEFDLLLAENVLRRLQTASATD